MMALRFRPKWDMHEVTLRTRSCIEKKGTQLQCRGFTRRLFRSRQLFRADDFHRRPDIDGRFHLWRYRRRIHGHASLGAAIGDDCVCIFCGRNSPLILRRVRTDDPGDGERHRCFGECYVHGIMNGELVHVDLAREFLLA